MQYHYQRNKMKDVHNNYYKALTIESISDSTPLLPIGAYMRRRAKILISI